MKNRLSRIVTRTGDKGSTGLGDGSRVSKDSLRIHAIGDIDELNSAMGMLACEIPSGEMRQEVLDIQQELFDLGGELSIPGHTSITAQKVERLESVLEKYNAELAPLKDFVLPGGSRAAATAHLCRSICRRAERSVVSLSKVEAISEPLLQYINRLSDLLFVLARSQNHQEGRQDVLWDKGRQPHQH
jgi:cob(I)alamin adenosyltransferase